MAVFKAIVFSGTGAAGNAVTGAGFAPKLIIFKHLAGTQPATMANSIRGTEIGVTLDAAGAEAAHSGGVTTFGADGFTVGAHANYNTSGTNNMLAWCFADDPSSGSDLLSFAAATSPISHSLGVAPDFVFHKEATQVGESHYVAFNQATSFAYFVESNAARAASANYFTSFSTTTYGVGSVLDDSVGFALALAQSAGLIKIGTYTGNGSSTGPTVSSLGFAPAALLVKRRDSTGSWHIWDSTRSTSNPRNKVIRFDLAELEQDSSTYSVDFNADSFQLKTATADLNANLGVYEYIALSAGVVAYSQTVTVACAGTVSVVKSVAKTVTATCASAGAVIKSVGKIVSATVSSVVTVSTPRTVVQTVAATCASAVVMARDISFTVTVACLGTVAAIKAISFSIALTCASVVTVLTPRTVIQSISATCATAASVVKQAQIIVSTAVSSLVVFFREYWTQGTSQDETWTERSADDETWTVKTKANETWTERTASDETWTERSEDSEGWS
jgi:hypothetical protein